MKNGRYFNFRDICDRNLWDTGYLVKKLQGYGILRPPLIGPHHRSRLTTLSLIWFLWDAKEPTPLFKKSRDVDPGGVANLFWAGWVRVRRDLNIGVTQITAYK